jgi:hypothetical protein
MSVPPHELASRNPGIRTAQRFADQRMPTTASYMPSSYHHDIHNTSCGFDGRSSSPPRSTASSFNPYTSPATSSLYRGDGQCTPRTANPYMSSGATPYTASNFGTRSAMARSSSPFMPTTSSPFGSSGRAAMTGSYYNPSSPSSADIRSMHSTSGQYRSGSPVTASAYRPATTSSMYGAGIRNTSSHMPQPIFQPTRTATAYGQYW